MTARLGQPQNRLERTIDGALHLLDRQLLDRDGRMLGKVDDIGLTQLDEALAITSLLTGQAALLQRLGGRLGAVLVDRWGRLRVSEPHRTRPWRIDLADVERLDSAVHLAVLREGILRRDRDEMRLGDLTGMDVLGPGGRVGRVLDARFEPHGGHLVLASLVVGHGRPGSLLGYDRRGDQGPWAVRLVIRRLHRHTVVVPAEHTQIDWVLHEVRVDPYEPQAPHHTAKQ